MSQPNPSNWPLLVAHERWINPANQEIGVPGEETIHPTLFPSFSAKAGNPEIQTVKKKQTHLAQWMGLKALRRGLGVGGRNR